MCFNCFQHKLQSVNPGFRERKGDFFSMGVPEDWLETEWNMTQNCHSNNQLGSIKYGNRDVITLQGERNVFSTFSGISDSVLLSQKLVQNDNWMRSIFSRLSCCGLHSFSEFNTDRDPTVAICATTHTNTEIWTVSFSASSPTICSVLSMEACHWPERPSVTFSSRGATALLCFH